MQRLRDKMREDLALRGMSAGTIVMYLGCARRFAEYFGRALECRHITCERQDFVRIRQELAAHAELLQQCVAIGA